MKLAIPKERHSDEARVAISPDVIKRLIGLGFDVVVESGAGEASNFPDSVLRDAGATIAKSASDALKDAGVVFKVRAPTVSGKNTELSSYAKGTVLLAQLGVLGNPEIAEACAKAGVTAFAMELMPRISRAQSMDVLSSQSNLAGYRAIIEAGNQLHRAFPMMMTAAGTVPPAKAFIMGVGVAGLQAIATAKRLGAVVTATDVRPATKEQVASLGGKFLEVDADMEKDAQTEGGYAKEMPPEYFEKQKAVVAEHIKKQDIVVTTALVPGRPAPRLISKEMVATMKPGAVVVDLAAEAGGNCELTEPGKVVVKNGVTIVGYTNWPALVAEDASGLFARNLFNFISPHVDKESKTLSIDWEDETVTGTLVARDGKVTNDRVLEALSSKPVAKTAAKKKSGTRTAKSGTSSKPASEE
ncbi:MAG: Re/Si-specific NAD(P)(+) transhydrogenase subunit alpha [Rhodospirillales bacterium]